MSAEAASKNGWRDVVAAGLYYSGGLRLLQGISRNYEFAASSARRFPRLERASGAKFVILCYHRVAPGGFPFISSVAPEEFEAQMRFLRNRYRVISLDEMCASLENPAAAGQAVAVTFDDGYRDLYTNAFPTLKKYEIPATIFLTVDSIGTGEVAWYDRIFLATHIFPGNRLDVELDTMRSFELTTTETRRQAAIQIVKQLRRMPDERRRECCAALDRKVVLPAADLAGKMLTWEHVDEMHRAGVAFGSHTATHPVVSRLSNEAAEQELRWSKRIMEDRLRKPVTHFAYPFGQPADCGLAAEPILQDCGYSSAGTTSWGSNAFGADRYRLRRVQIGEDSSLSLFALRLGQLFLGAAENGSARNSRERVVTQGVGAEDVRRSVSS